jgi:threonine dehydratase
VIATLDINRAAERIARHIVRTPLLACADLGERSGVTISLKCECFQQTGSFKARGALNKVLSLHAHEMKQGLIGVSAGNHAKALAWAARQVGVPCAVVMPADAPRSKIDAVRGYGAEAILHDDRAAVFDRLAKEQKARGAFFVHPFDDPTVIAGAGTVGLEIVEDSPAADAVLVPVGGGGLIAGIASAIKGLQPRTRVIGVELAAGPGLGPALKAGKPVTVKRPMDTLADGMTPPFVGKIPLDVAREAVDDVVTVSEDEIIEAMRLLLTHAKLYVEGSGAAAVAAVLFRKASLPAGSNVVAVVSGGNVDLERFFDAVKQ